jgi:aspartyl-tRNA(Asn)/glutamyl-tRNA(Gln) amidotransferase subunit A
VETTSLWETSVAELAGRIKKREVSPVEVIKAHLSRIESVEPILNSFITLLTDQALAAAREAEREIQSGRYRGPLHGIPFGLKDLFYVKGVRNTSGSKLFEDFVPNFDSTAAKRLQQAGAILLGKLNLHPFAYGPTGENLEYGHMHNPWDPSLIAGGSSGGSGSAVAAGECAFAIGTDTGGSIRIPAALCGVVGFKPTYGLVSRFGITPLSWSQDHAGPLTRTVEDTALVLNSLAGHDPDDPTSVRIRALDFAKDLTKGIQGLRLGVPMEYFESPIAPEVKGAVIKAIERLEELGAAVAEISWPAYHDHSAIAGMIQLSEATAYHSRLIREKGSRLHPNVRLRLEAGLFVSAEAYVQAQRARRLFYRRSLDLLKEVDILAGPAVPVKAFKIGTKRVKMGEKEISVTPLLTQYTRPFNLNGFPAITVPCGISEEGLPIGLQLSGRPFEDGTVLRTAHAYEQATDWHQRKPVF